MEPGTSLCGHSCILLLHHRPALVAMILNCPVLRLAGNTAWIPKPSFSTQYILSICFCPLKDLCDDVT